MDTRTSTILIAGAGIGGLATAIALVQAGFRVEVYEQAEQLNEVGAGLQVSANAVRVLYELGVGEQARDLACQAEGKEIRLWNTGDRWKLFDLGAESVDLYGFPYLLMHRADLHNLLMRRFQEVAPGALHLGRRCVGASQDADGVALHLDDGDTATGAVLIGADGVHSSIRNQLHGQGAPQWAGCVAWRGTIEVSRLPSHMVRNVATNWVGKGAHVVHYPVRQGKLFNFVGVVERDDWRIESWTERGTTEECLADFEGWHEDVQELISHIEEPYKWALLIRPPLKYWGEGRITLLGDAAHPTLPFLAQGACMALEDAAILARTLTAHSDDPAKALSRYESIRLDRTSKIVEKSTENLERFHASVLSDPVEAGAYVDREWSEDAVRQRYQWLFEYDVNAVAI